MDFLRIISYGVYFVAALAFGDYLEKSGKFERVFKVRMQYWHFVVVFVAAQIIPAVLPDFIAIIIAVAIVSAYIGWRIGNNKKE